MKFLLPSSESSDPATVGRKASTLASLAKHEFAIPP